MTSLRQLGHRVPHVHQVVRTPAGELVADQRIDHLYTFREDKIARFDIDPAPAA